MPSAPGSSLLPPVERQLFVEQFEKDMKFFQLFFLMVNRACPIKNVDLVWTDSEGAGRVGFRHLGITEALSGPCSRMLGCSNENPHPAFCNIISDFGRREPESCGVSDKAAAERVGKSGKSEVYRCNFGLVDIAVPVMWNGVHIATLYSGQVLSERPTRRAFARVRAVAGQLGYVNTADLERAYFEVPVVGEAEIGNTRAILEAFAEFLSNSWTRLAEAIKERQRELRERQLTAKEFAYLLLQDGVTPHTLRDPARRLRITRMPNRVMLIVPETESEYAARNVPYDLGLTSLIQAVEDTCETLPNVTAAYLRGRGICVFFSDREARNPAAGHFNAMRLARRILGAAAERSDMRVRAGIGGAKADWHALQESYREARMALSGSQEEVATYTQPAKPVRELSSSAEAICAALRDREHAAADERIAAFPGQVNRWLGGNLAAQRVAYASALELELLTAEKCGAEAAAITQLRDTFTSGLGVAGAGLELEDAYLNAARQILAEVARVYRSRRQKIIERVCRIVERRLSGGTGPVTVPALAAEAGVSASHLSRLFHREMGQTLESYILEQRIGKAKRLLLDPAGSVSQVAESCGFVDPNYFSRAFRKVTGCSPREYRQAPTQLTATKSR